MTGRELIIQLLEEDLDSDVVIEICSGRQEVRRLVQVDGLGRNSSYINGIIILPEPYLVEYDFDTKEIVDKKP